MNLTLVSLALIWATWDVCRRYMDSRKPPVQTPHCCACDQFDRKCEALESGAVFPETASL